MLSGTKLPRRIIGCISVTDANHCHSDANHCHRRKAPNRTGEIHLSLFPETNQYWFDSTCQPFTFPTWNSINMDVKICWHTVLLSYCFVVLLTCRFAVLRTHCFVVLQTCFFAVLRTHCFVVLLIHCFQYGFTTPDQRWNMTMVQSICRSLRID